MSAPRDLANPLVSVAMSLRGSQTGGMLLPLATAGGLWLLSDIGYYLLLPAMGITPDYNREPVAITLYYAVWVALALGTYRHAIRDWQAPRGRAIGHILPLLSLTALAGFAIYVLPLVPQTSWTATWQPPELRMAGSAYFLPKGMEILFQQLLVTGLVLRLSTMSCSLLRISLCCAALFGGAHALLLLGGMPFGYTLRFMSAATLFGLVFPYFLTRVPHGLAYTYTLHWLYYAVMSSVARFLGSGQ